MPGWLLATIAGAFALLYAYAVWSGIAYLIASVQEFSAIGLSLAPMVWVVLVLAIVVPIAAFAAAFAMGRTGGPGRLALLLLAGLALTAVFWLDMQAYTTTAVVVG
jgi:hypothetical protein